MKIFQKINVTDIIKNHFKTLVDARTHKVGQDDIVTFLIVPLLIASALMYFKVTISSGATTIIITSLAIFVGLLINMVVLLFDLLGRDGKSDIKIRILKQLLTNILFTILLSIILILLSLIGLAPITCSTSSTLINIISGFDCLIYFLLSFLFFTLLMVLKRMYALFNNEISEIEHAEQEKRKLRNEKEIE